MRQRKRDLVRREKNEQEQSKSGRGKKKERKKEQRRSFGEEPLYEHYNRRLNQLAQFTKSN